MNEKTVRQLVDRLAELGVLDSPAVKRGDYTVEFPDKDDRPK